MEIDSYSFCSNTIADKYYVIAGGDKIMMGAGGSVEPFWALYAVHKNPHVLNIFEKYRIGQWQAL